MTHPILNTIKTEWGYLGRKKRLFIIYIILFVIAGAIELLTPYVLGTIFNSIQNSISSQEELQGLLFKISLLFFLTFVFWIFHGFGRVLEQTTGFFVRKNYVNDKMRVVLKLPIKWHKDHHSGDTIDKINRASNSLEEFASHRTFEIVYALINFFGSLAVMFFIDWKIGLFALLFSCGVLFVITQVDKNLDKKYRELNTFNNAYSATVFDYISNVITVITLRLRRIVSAEIDSKQSASYPTLKASVIMSEAKWAFASIALKLMVVAILIYKAYTDYHFSGTILIGTLYMLYGYLDFIGSTFFRFASMYGEIIKTNARIVGAYPLDEEYAKLEDVQVSPLPNGWKNLSFKGISFTYDTDGKLNHLDNINFEFKRGQRIALVGESGSGKSTILALIRGLYNIDKGEIYCDKQLLAAGIHRVKQNVTLIPQEPEIFNNTFRYNITMNLPASEENIRKAITISQLEPVLEKLPNGLDTSVMEKGVSLSGGEKQRLALARGILAAMKSDIVLMDEPTSSVDSLNEIKIHDNVFSEFRHKTIISSIHRLHLLDKFDYIYLFSRGKIIAHGTLPELKKNPIFHEMWKKYNREKLKDKEELRK